MFILLAIILWVISISLRLSASSLELASKVANRAVRKTEIGNSKVGKVTRGVATVGVTSSASFLRLCAFVISRVKDLVLWVGSFVLLIDIVILVIMVVVVSSYMVVLQ